MVTLLLSILTSFAVSAQVEESIKNLDPNKFTVCAITINSSEEKEVFRTNIEKDKKNFNPIIELTEFEGNDWFEKACQSKVKCDQLVISGHFAGTFFGKSAKSLPIKTLESQSCSSTCPGILNDPYEVFLFGCNTLAGKEKDHRTPAQYYQVLIDDGFSPQDARMIVEYRYGQTGSDFKSTMQRSFGGDKKQLYGFHSVGPSGKKVESFLKNYFKQINPTAHLKKQQAKRLLDKVDMSNSLLSNSLKGTAFAQCAASDKEMDESTKLMCKIIDESKPIDERISAMADALAHENYLIFIPAINQFFQKHPLDSLSQQQKKDLEVISKNDTLIKQINGITSSIKDLGMLLEWGNLAANLNLPINTDNLTAEVNTIFRSPVTTMEKDRICSSSIAIRKKIKLDVKGIDLSRLNNNQSQLLGCLAVDDYETQSQYMKVFTKGLFIHQNEVLADWANRKSLNQKTVSDLLKMYEDETSPHPSFRPTIAAFIEANGSVDQKNKETILRLMKARPGLSLNLADALGAVDSNDETTLNTLLQIGYAPKVLQSNPVNKKIQEEAVLKVIANSDWKESSTLANLTMDFIKKYPQSNPEILYEIALLTGENRIRYDMGFNQKAKDYFLQNPTSSPRIVGAMAKSVRNMDDVEFLKGQLKQFNALPVEAQKELMKPNLVMHVDYRLAIYSLYPKSLTKETKAFLKEELKRFTTDDQERAKKILRDSN